MQLRRKRFDDSAEVRETELTRVEVVELGELAVGRVAFQPGWRWSEHVKPITGTEYCNVHHVGYVISGCLHVEMDGGASVDLVAGDVFEVPAGHDAWVVGDEPWVSVDYAGRRLFAKAMNDYADRVLRTVVFTDLSRSTETLERLGDTRWRMLLAEHNQRARAAMEHYSGREVDSAGDGFLVVFDSPAAAVRGAAAMIDAAASLDLTARAAVHTGEVELQGDNVRGIAVHLAARVLGLSKPGEVLVTSTVQELLEGSGLAFAERGEHDLKGISGRRSLAALVR